MEIVHLILGKANPQRMNGVNKVVHQLATHQASLGHHVQVWGITPTPEGAYPNRTYETRLFQSWKNKFRFDRQLAEAIRKAPIDTAFHLHGGFIPEFYHAAKVLHASGHQYVFTPHGSYNTIALEKNHLVKSLYFPLFEKKVLDHAKCLHFLGQTELNAADKLAPEKEKVLIPNGQDLNELKFNFKPMDKLDGPIFGFCGRMDAYTKGLDLLIEAFARYKNDFHSPGLLWMIGDGEDLHWLKQKAIEFGVSDQVVFYGSKYGEEKLNLIANMDVFLHPSRNEGLPMSVLEASSLLVPCIVSEETNMAATIREYEAGISLPANTVGDLLMAMRTALFEIRDRKWELKRYQARKMVQAEFDWKNIALKLVNAYAA